jgi:hypothetical protein
MSMGILDIIAKSAGQLNADGERITKWIDLDPGWKFLIIVTLIGAPFTIFSFLVEGF